MPDSVTVYQVRLPHHRPCAVTPVVMAESWGSDITAPEAVEQMFGCIPFPWNLYVGVADTPAGLEKRLARMHDPERLFAARQDRIRKRLMDKDPMFFDQLIGPTLEGDTYTLEYYQDRQRQIADMHRKVTVDADQVGRLWISPEAERLKRFALASISDSVIFPAIPHHLHQLPCPLRRVMLRPFTVQAFRLSFDKIPTPDSSNEFLERPESARPELESHVHQDFLNMVRKRIELTREYFLQVPSAFVQVVLEHKPCLRIADTYRFQIAAHSTRKVPCRTFVWELPVSFVPFNGPV
jgi:hypothetical protein